MQLIRKWIGVCLLLSLMAPDALCQQKELTVDAFLSQVKTNHPIARQAYLQVDGANARLLEARGSFDPVLEYSSNAKTLSGTDYYDYNQASLKVKTASPFTVKAGFESSRGVYKDPQLTPGVLSYAGLELDVLRGWVTDKQRTALQKAKLYVSMSRAEQQIMINDLLYEAQLAYWQWATAYKRLELYNTFMEFADRRFSLTKLLYENGDRSRADTTEAYTQLQSYRLGLLSARQELQTSAVALSAFYWTTAGVAENPAVGVAPQEPAVFLLTAALDRPVVSPVGIIPSNPQLTFYEIKDQQWKAEVRLARQQLLPEIKLQTNLISKDYFTFKGWSSQYFTNNYKYGVAVKFPLFRRQERGNFSALKISREQNQQVLANKTRELQVKLEQYNIDLNMLREQLNETAVLTGNLSYLLEIENLKFRSGESSLFLINSRETKLLEAQQKQIDIQQKAIKAYLAYLWANGEFANIP